MGDGWWVMVDGWWNGKGLIFFANYSKTDWYNYLIVSRPLQTCFKTSFMKKSKKMKKTKFFKKIRTNRVWGKNRNFSKKARSSHVRPSFECCQPSSHLRGPRRGAPLVSVTNQIHETRNWNKINMGYIQRFKDSSSKSVTRISESWIATEDRWHR